MPALCINNASPIPRSARACHEANRKHCEAHGDASQKPWREAEQWQRDSAIAGVEFRLNNPTAPASEQHDAWMRGKIADGWSYGPIKDAEHKTHPCLVPYDQLPSEQQAKDAIFIAVVDALAAIGDAEDDDVTGADRQVILDKTWRRDIDAIIQRLKEGLPPER